MTSTGTHCVRVHYSCDPDKNPETEVGKKWVEMAQENVPPDDWEQEMEINYRAHKGRPVISNWKRHIFVKPLDYDSELPLRIVCDYGTEVAVAAFAQYVPVPGFNFRQLKILDEIVLRNSNTNELALAIIDYMKGKFTRSWETHNYIMYCDVAGTQGKAEVSDPSLNSSIKIMRSHGFHPRCKRMFIPDSTAVVKTVFAQVGPNGEPAIVIDPRADYMIQCASGGWHFPDKPGAREGYPDKDGEFDHGGDIYRYLICNIIPYSDITLKRRVYNPPIPIRMEYTGRIVGYRRRKDSTRKYARAL